MESVGPVGSGSGFPVGRDGGGVNNHHVVDGCAGVGVGRAGASHGATVRAVGADAGSALLEAPPGTGEAVTGYTLHGLLSREFDVTSGNVSALAGLDDDAKRLQITAPGWR